MEYLKGASLGQSSVMFQGKAGAYPIEASFMCSTLGQAPGFTHKHYNRFGMLNSDKHSSLLHKSVNYGRKKVDNIEPSFSKIL